MIDWIGKDGLAHAGADHAAGPGDDDDDDDETPIGDPDEDEGYGDDDEDDEDDDADTLWACRRSARCQVKGA